MDSRNSYSFFGNPLPSFYLEIAEPHPPSVRCEHQDPFIEKGFVTNACRHMLLVSNRNRQLGDAFPDVFFSLQWPRGFVLYGVCPFYSIGVPHQDRRAMYGLWASLSRCNPLRHVDDSSLRKRTFHLPPDTPHLV